MKERNLILTKKSKITIQLNNFFYYKFKKRCCPIKQKSSLDIF